MQGTENTENATDPRRAIGRIRLVQREMMDLVIGQHLLSAPGQKGMPTIAAGFMGAVAEPRLWCIDRGQRSQGAFLSPQSADREDDLLQIALDQLPTDDRRLQFTVQKRIRRWTRAGSVSRTGAGRSARHGCAIAAANDPANHHVLSGGPGVHA